MSNDEHDQNDLEEYYDGSLNPVDEDEFDNLLSLVLVPGSQLNTAMTHAVNHGSDETCKPF